MFLEHGVPPPQNVIETSSLPVLTSLLRGSDMLAALPADAVAPYVQAKLLAVLPIALGVRMESFGIIRRRDYMLPPGAERILLALRNAAKRLYPERPPG
jgi:DNA-binding transcriptional LysR family regulator